MSRSPSVTGRMEIKRAPSTERSTEVMPRLLVSPRKSIHAHTAIGARVFRRKSFDTAFISFTSPMVSSLALLGVSITLLNPACPFWFPVVPVPPIFGNFLFT